MINLRIATSEGVLDASHGNAHVQRLDDIFVIVYLTPSYRVKYHAYDAKRNKWHEINAVETIRAIETGEISLSEDSEIGFQLLVRAIYESDDKQLYEMRVPPCVPSSVLQAIGRGTQIKSLARTTVVGSAMYPSTTMHRVARAIANEYDGAPQSLYLVEDEDGFFVPQPVTEIYAVENGRTTYRNTTKVTLSFLTFGLGAPTPIYDTLLRLHCGDIDRFEASRGDLRFTYESGHAILVVGRNVWHVKGSDIHAVLERMNEPFAKPPIVRERFLPIDDNEADEKLYVARYRIYTDDEVPESLLEQLDTFIDPVCTPYSFTYGERDDFESFVDIDIDASAITFYPKRLW